MHRFLKIEKIIRSSTLTCIIQSINHVSSTIECTWVNILVKYSVLILRQTGVKNLPLSFLICSKWLVTLTNKKKKALLNLTLSDWKLQLLNLVNLFSLFQCHSCPGYRIHVSRHDFYSLSLSVCIKLILFEWSRFEREICIILYDYPVLTSTQHRVCFFCKFYICFQNGKMQKLLRGEV